jgi:hypothetical protein
VQPAQLSLLVGDVPPAPPPLSCLPEDELARALGLLAELIAKASVEGVGTDER